jgi:hypothetical protein
MPGADAGYTIATLSTDAGTRAERFYRADGWTETGRIRRVRLFSRGDCDERLMAGLCDVHARASIVIFISRGSERTGPLTSRSRSSLRRLLRWLTRVTAKRSAA